MYMHFLHVYYSISQQISRRQHAFLFKMHIHVHYQRQIHLFYSTASFIKVITSHISWGLLLYYNRVHPSRVLPMFLKAKKINTHGSRRRAHHFSRPHQLFFYLKKNSNKIIQKKIYKKNAIFFFKTKKYLFI